MDYSEAINAMRGYFEQEWAELTPVAWGSDDVYQPDTKTWVRFNILHNDGFQASTGSPDSNRFHRFGVVTIQIFARQGDYGRDAVEKATAALKVYEFVQNNAIHYYDATIKEVGNDGNGWHQINVLTKFRYEEIT